MRALEARQVERVVWVNLSTRTGRADYVAANQALAAARSRWPDLFVLDWALVQRRQRPATATAGSPPTASTSPPPARPRWPASSATSSLPLADFPVGSSIFTWDRETGAWAIRSMSD